MRWKRIYSKAALTTFSLAAIMATFFFFFIGSIDIRPRFSSFFQPGPSEPPPCLPLRVYMYDLPPKFNVGMLGSRSSDDAPVTAETLPPWSTKAGLRKQHSVEYWMMAYLLYDGREREKMKLEAIRVSDPEIADVFFVPFFSSLSLSTHGRNMTDPKTEGDRQLQVDILKFLRESKYWQRSQGRDHVIPMHHPNAFRFLRDQINASILIVSDFGRYEKNVSNLRKDVVAPYVHVVDSYTNDDTQDPFESCKTLLFFRGRTVRKGEGSVRAELQKILAGYDDVHYERSVASAENIKKSTEGMRSTKFCLDPAGDTPSSCRLFDAIVSHCVPVIVSDKVELPYEDELDYTRFSIFFSDQEAVKPGYMVEQLRKFPKDKWVDMWKMLKNISHHYEFQYPPKSGDAADMIWREVRHKLPAAKPAVHRTRRLKIPDWWGNRRR
uniref:Exostosin GT47 domain-containing protein n=1 Tax=Opuntia streptacantha TaxID=393608 RepID=A0A7C9AXF7_OPUST